MPMWSRDRQAGVVRAERGEEATCTKASRKNGEDAGVLVHKRERLGCSGRDP